MSISIKYQNRFRELIDETEKNKTVIAAEIGISYSIFSNSYKYGIIPKPLLLMRIADYFNISVEYLLGNTDSTYFDKSALPKSFQERLGEQRNKHKLTYYKIADIVHINKNYFSEWRRKHFMPTLDNLILLADYFNISLDYLLGRTDDDTPYTEGKE